MDDHVADIRKYARGPVSEAAVGSMARTYRLVMNNADSKFVACSDASERAHIRDSFLKKKLGLDGDQLDDAIMAVCQAMKSDRSKSRLTFYYLLAEHFDRLDSFA